MVEIEALEPLMRTWPKKGSKQAVKDTTNESKNGEDEDESRPGREDAGIEL